MLTLILETSTEKGCVVLSAEGRPIEHLMLAGGPELSKRLALDVKTLLNGKVPKLIAIGIGPGSYTGIRVGTALAKGLSYGWKIPLLGFTSLKAFGPGPVLVDARGGGFYALIGEEPELISPTSSTLQKISCFSSPHPEQIKKRLLTDAILLKKSPDPELLAELVYTQFLEEGAKPFELNYLGCP